MQAGLLARGLVVAHVYEPVKWIAAHFPTAQDWCACSVRGETYPVYLAYRTAADLLEGAVATGTLDLGDGIAAYGFRRPSGSKVIALWDEQGRTVKLPQTTGWSAFDILGRPLPAPQEGKLKLSAYPIYLTNGDLNEGTVPTPLR